MTKRVVAFCAALLTFVVVLGVALWGATFGIDGSVSRSLLPGSTSTITLRISNPHFYPIVVSGVRVRITSVTPGRKGQTCRASNFTVRQAPHLRVRLGANSTFTLTEGSAGKTALPSLHLTGDRAQLEDGCQGATVNLAFAASGNWWTK